METKKEIQLTREEKRELKEWLYDRLSVLCEYHDDLYPKKRDSLHTLMWRYFYWGAEYNNNYIPEKDDHDEKLSEYLVQEFEKFLAIPESIRY